MAPQIVSYPPVFKRGARKDAAPLNVPAPAPSMATASSDPDGLRKQDGAIRSRAGRVRKSLS
jgi:hypothetical protein